MNPTDDREYRLRQRIDELLDRVAERDAAIERCRQGRQRLYARVYLLERSRELWRQRASQR